MKIEPIPLLRDNYAWLISVAGSNSCAVVDPSEGGPLLRLIEERGLELRTIIATHHHWDHVNGINELLSHYRGVDVVCSSYDYENNRVPGATLPQEDGDTFVLLGKMVRCMMVPGHTLGAIAYYVKEARAVFTGDTLFTAGCGRLFEGTPRQMHDSLSSLASLPADTLVYCGHEYTESNLRFALAMEPYNQAVLARLKVVQEMRGNGEPTVPSTIGEELRSNPFLRVTDRHLAASVGRDAPEEVFAELRSRKDQF
tara:strand:- start:40 stop:804 length:765 start_codon:yes stop_codon:yes gene_type:complete